ncbi:Protein kinase C zeta type [Hypsizygus marmoreus]|uniref:non-specific serine/threonine protein kinase n=1 Tax=Hypsizygus marmoreus TaxID=39966 RepID=A0A369JPL5_HYPMA|nr:Protein kinase C zeta type [Hypsizygus marmoreus]
MLYKTPSSTPNTGTPSSLPPPIDTQERTLADFDLYKCLHRSPASTTFMGRDQRTDKIVTIKVIAKLGRDEADFSFLQSEQRILRSIAEDESVSFLPLLCSWHDSINFYLVTEYHAGGDFGFECMRSPRMDEDRARFYAAEIVVALEELERRNIVHRDIKPSNMIMTADGHLRLIDFGYAVQLSAPDIPEDFNFDVDASSDSGSFLQDLASPPMLKGSCGTPYFKCPEELLGRPYGNKKDVFGGGVSLHWMLLSRMPFGHAFAVTERVAIETAVIHEPLKFRQEDNISIEAQDLIRGMLAKDPRDRLSVGEIKQHPWFAGIDWEKAAKHELPAPWKPFIPPVPKVAMLTRPVQKGRTLDQWDDFMPEFRFTSALLDPPKAPVPETIKKGLFGFAKATKDAPVFVRIKVEKEVKLTQDKDIAIPVKHDDKPRSFFAKSKPRAAEPKAPEPFSFMKSDSDPQLKQKAPSFFSKLFCTSKTKATTAKPEVPAPEPMPVPVPVPQPLTKRNTAYWAAHIEAAFGPASLSDYRTPKAAAKRDSLRPLRLPELVASRSPSSSPSPSPTLYSPSPSPPPLLWDAKLLEPHTIPQADRDRIYGVPAEFRTDWASKLKRALSRHVYHSPQSQSRNPEPKEEVKDYSYYVNNPRRGVVPGPHYSPGMAGSGPRKLGLWGKVRVVPRRVLIRCQLAVSRALVYLGPGPIVEPAGAAAARWAAHSCGVPICF